MALGFGVVLVGIWDLELEKPSGGNGKAGYLSLTIFYLMLLFFTLFNKLPVSVQRRIDGRCNDVTNPIWLQRAPRYLYSEITHSSIYVFGQYQYL